MNDESTTTPRISAAVPLARDICFLNSRLPGPGSTLSPSTTPMTETDPSPEPSSPLSPQPTPSSTPSGAGLRHDGGKLPLHLVPPEVAVAIAAVLRHGAKKYAERNWEMGMNWETCAACLDRHYQKWQAGFDLDNESGLPHTWHMLCNIAFLVAYEARGKGVDNRPDLGYTPERIEQLHPILKEFFKS